MAYRINGFRWAVGFLPPYLIDLTLRGCCNKCTVRSLANGYCAVDAALEVNVAGWVIVSYVDVADTVSRFFNRSCLVVSRFAVLDYFNTVQFCGI